MAESDTDALMPDARPRERPQLPFMTAMGIVFLVMAATVYPAFGYAAYPRQEWLIELLVGVIFLIPAVNLLVTRGLLSSAVRVVGAALLAHSAYDLLHWPSHPLIDTPVPYYIPKLCPVGDLTIGTLLLIRGR